MITQQNTPPQQTGATTIPISCGSIYKNNVSFYLKKNLQQEINSFIASGQAKTGYSNLDAIIGRLYPGLYVLGAGSSLGKTTFLLQMADQLIADCEPVLYFTMEQSQLELVTKTLSRRAALKCKTNPKMAKTAIQIRRGDYYTGSKGCISGLLS